MDLVFFCDAIETSQTAD